MSEKTEPPTPKKIRDAREKGQFLFSREIVAGGILIALTALFLLSWRFFLQGVMSLVDGVLDRFHQDFHEVMPQILLESMFFAAVISLGVYGVSVVTAIIGNLGQVGFVFSTAKITKGVQSLNFINNAKQMFSLRNLFNFGMNIVKLLLIGYIAYLIAQDFVRDFFSSVQCGLPCVLWSAGQAFGWLFAILAALYLPIAVIDFIIQRAFYLKELKMTKEEVKQEYKEMEGNPEIKAQRRQTHRELLENETLNAVRQSTMVIKNPSHYAVALLYDEEKTPLPLVTGKGEGSLAREMIRVAEQEDIPVYENVDLAQGLFHDIELGHYITQDFIVPVAEAIHYIQQMKDRG